MLFWVDIHGHDEYPRKMLCANAKHVYFNSIWRAGCVFLIVGCGFPGRWSDVGELVCWEDGG